MDYAEACQEQFPGSWLEWRPRLRRVAVRCTRNSVYDPRVFIVCPTARRDAACRKPHDASHVSSAAILAVFLFAILSAGVATPVVQAQSAMPSITGVSITGAPGNYIATVTGSGFGSFAGQLPFSGDVPNFRIADSAQIGHGEYGYTGDANTLDYESWTENQIRVSGLAASPGDALVLALWNTTSGNGVSWGGNVPPPPSAPEITAVAFSGSSSNPIVIVYGSGFGTAPVPMPYTGSVQSFIVNDWREYHAGMGQSSTWTGGIAENFQSWSETEIVIDGFSGTYGSGPNVLDPNDPISIQIWSPASSFDTGPQTAWGGRAALTSLVNPVPGCLSGPTQSFVTPLPNVMTSYTNSLLLPPASFTFDSPTLTWHLAQASDSSCSLMSDAGTVKIQETKGPELLAPEQVGTSVGEADVAFVPAVDVSASKCNFSTYSKFPVPPLVTLPTGCYIDTPPSTGSPATGPPSGEVLQWHTNGFTETAEKNLLDEALGILAGKLGVPPLSQPTTYYVNLNWAVLFAGGARGACPSTAATYGDYEALCNAEATLHETLIKEAVGPFVDLVLGGPALEVEVDPPRHPGTEVIVRSPRGRIAGVTASGKVVKTILGSAVIHLARGVGIAIRDPEAGQYTMMITGRPGVRDAVEVLERNGASSDDVHLQRFRAVVGHNGRNRSTISVRRRVRVKPRRRR